MLDSVKNPQSKFVPDARQNRIRFKIGAFVFPGIRTQATQVSSVKPLYYFESACKFSCKGRSLFGVGGNIWYLKSACTFATDVSMFVGRGPLSLPMQKACQTTKFETFEKVFNETKCCNLLNFVSWVMRNTRMKWCKHAS